MLKIKGAALGLPNKKITDIEYDQLAQLAPGTSYRQTKIKERYFVTMETSTDLAVKAISNLLYKVNKTYQDIDLLVSASATDDIAIPYNAAMIHAKLDGNYKHSIHTFDVGASCLSFLNALDVVYSLMYCKGYKRAIIVSSDVSHYCLDLSNVVENGIFGDGAAAVMVEVNNSLPSNILASKFITASAGVNFCKINHGGSRAAKGSPYEHEANANFKMDAKNIYKLSRQIVPDFIKGLVSSAYLSLDDINCFIPHQASHHAIEHLQKALNVPSEKVINIFSKFGNQVAASLPTALTCGIDSGCFKDGDKIMLFGTGAGLTVGGMIMEYQS